MLGVRSIGTLSEVTEIERYDYARLVTSTSNIQIPITLRPSRTRVAVLFLLSLMFVVGCIWMVRDGDRGGYFVAGFFALGLPVFAFQFHPKAAYLRLAHDGFTFCVLFRTHTVRWAEVRRFGVTRIWNRMVAWNYTAEYQPYARSRAVSKSLFGYDGALPDSYGMKPHELADLLETLRQRYLETSNA